MHKLRYVGFLAILMLAPLFCAAEPEIVIEMHGTPAPATKTTNISIWDKTAPQLARLLRGKTREEALYSITVVSAKDRTISGTRQKYALVEYKKDKLFRKLLFQAKDPQLFLTAAATTQDVLAVNKKYAVNIGLGQGDFENTYKNEFTSETDPDLPQNAVLYKLAYTDVNTSTATDHWYLFEDQQLRQTFYTKEDKDTYLQTLRPAQAQAPAAPQSKKKQKRPPFKALISGGTTWDQSYLPRIIDPKKLKDSQETESDSQNNSH